MNRNYFFRFLFKDWLNLSKKRLSEVRKKSVSIISIDRRNFCRMFSVSLVDLFEGSYRLILGEISSITLKEAIESIELFQNKSPSFS